MNRTQEQELMAYLISLGFFDEPLYEAIHKSDRLNLPSFNVQYSMTGIADGKAKTMSYDLHFIRDAETNAYRLDKYEATFHQPLVINHGRLNGIDTAELEERMKAVDWQKYFENEPYDLEEGQYEKAHAVMNDMVKLSARNNASGWDVGRRLQYKYWPEQFHDEAAKSLHQELQYSKTFTANEQGICSAYLAEDILTGKVAEQDNKQKDILQKKKAPLRKIKIRRI